MATAPGARRIGRTAAARRLESGTEETGRRITTVSDRKGTIPETSQEAPAGRRVRFPPGEEPAYVSVAAGRTINMGDFNTLRLDVSITLPCRADNQSIEDTYEQASDLVAEYLGEEENRWAPTPARKR